MNIVCEIIGRWIACKNLGVTDGYQPYLIDKRSSDKICDAYLKKKNKQVTGSTVRTKSLRNS